MTDKEMLLHLCKKMDLKEVEKKDFLGKKEFHIDGNEITLGHGSGYGGFCVDFKFDNDGNIIKHGVWE